MNAQHEPFEGLILRLPDGDLTPEETASLREHLASCPACRRLFRAMEEVTRALDEDEDAVPPAALAEGVMARVRAYRDKNADEDALSDVPEEDAAARRSLARRQQSRKRRRRRSVGRVLALAAVFALVVTGGVFAARRLLGTVSSEASVTMSAALDAGAPQAAEPAAPAPEPAAYGAGMEAAEAEADEALEAPAAEEAAMEFEAAADELPAPEAAAAPLYTWESPAYVPEGRETAFEALLCTDRQDAAAGEGPALSLIAAVEYRGVIYEFLSDAGETCLYWRDAAEGATLNLSPAGVSDLWEIIGQE